MYILLIPEDRLVDFYISFFSSFLAGLTSGLLVGIIAGLFVWNFQRTVERKDTEFKASREVEVFLQHLRLNLDLSSLIELSEENESFLPLNSKQTVQLLMNSPIDTWVSSLKNNYQEELKQSRKLINEYRFLNRSFSNLKMKIDDRILTDYDNFNYEAYVFQFLAIICNVDIERLKKHFAVFNPITDGTLEYIEAIREEADIKPSVEDFLSKRNQFISQYTQLENVLK